MANLHIMPVEKFTKNFIERMENHFTGREIDLISHGNALRLIRDVLK